MTNKKKLLARKQFTLENDKKVNVVEVLFSLFDALLNNTLLSIKYKTQT